MSGTKSFNSFHVRFRTRIAWCAPVAACALFCHSTPAGAVRWTGDAHDYKWLSAGNWSTGDLPQSTDDVVIGAPGPATYTVRLTSGGSAQSVNSLTSYENLEVGGPNQMALYINQTSISNAAFTLDKCTLHLAGPMTWAGPSTWNAGGSVTGTGGIIIPSASILTAAPTTESIQLSCTLDNTGTINYTGQAAWNFSGGTINSSAIFNASGNGLIATGGVNAFNNAGTFNKIGDNPFVATIALNNSGMLEVHDGVFQSASFSNSGTLRIDQDSAFEATAALLNTGAIDLAGGTLLIDDGLAAGTLQKQLQSGLNGGAWNGDGIRSSLAAGNPYTALGYKFDGSICTLIYTWLGDADMNGIVNDADLAAMASSGSTNVGWTGGDFNYDGVVNADDYALFQLGVAYGSSGKVSAVFPEPSVALIGAGLCSLLCAGRSRRRR